MSNIDEIKKKLLLEVLDGQQMLQALISSSFYYEGEIKPFSLKDRPKKGLPPSSVTGKQARRAKRRREIARKDKRKNR
ncbi:MAG: hypothetical protein M0P14_07240 [Alkaliphilus sp.]|nr:hypothetical protein [Alkaliphilus sp.]